VSTTAIADSVGEPSFVSSSTDVPKAHPWRVSRFVLPATVVLATAVSLWLRSRSPLLLWSGTNFDDALFTRLAGSLADGVWLGQFDFVTLAKGPSLPLFIYVTYRLGIPLLMAQQLLYLLASGVLAISVARLARARWLGATLYVALALNPVHLGNVASRPVREVLYASLSLLLVGCLLLMVSVMPGLSRAPLWAGLITIPLAGLFTGGVAAAYYMCREERPWIVPALLAALGLGVLTWRRERSMAWRRGLGLLAAFLAITSLGFLAAVEQVKDRNRVTYGAPLVNDLVDGEIARAYRMWQSVEAGERRRFVPVSRDQRLAVYEVSPAARELVPELEGGLTAWFGAGCSFGVCDDYEGGHFVWAMREAAATAGHFSSGAAAQAYFGRVADEIQAACDDERLRCGRGGVPLLPAMSASDVVPLLTSSRETTLALFTFAAADPDRADLSGGGEPAEWRTMTRTLPEARDLTAFNAREIEAADDQGPVDFLFNAYRLTSPMVAALAVVGLAWGLARSRTRLLGLVCVVLALALAARVAVIAAVDAMTYPAAHSDSYAIPALDFLVAFSAVGCWLLVVSASDLIRSRRGRASTRRPRV